MLLGMRILLPQVVDDVTDQQLAEVAYAWPTQNQWVRANFAMSADGAIRDSSGRSAGVSSVDDKRVFMLLRATCEVVLVGAGTARDENYGAVRVRQGMADIRAESGLPKPALLAVVTGAANLDPNARMFAEPSADAKTIVITHERSAALVQQRIGDVAEVIAVGEDRVDLPAALNALSDRGLQRVLCEGGPHLFAGLLEAGLVDDLCATISPVLVGHDPNDPLTMVPSVLPEDIDLQLTSLTEANNTLMGCWQLVGKQD